MRTSYSLSRSWLTGLSVALMLSTGGLHAAPTTTPAPTLAPLAPTDIQSKVARLMTRQLSVLHYHRVPVDNALSEKILAGYLNALDGQRLFLLASDVEEFQRWRHQMDDQLRQGQLQPAFTIFSRYQARQRARLTEALEYLAQGRGVLDFSRDETLRVDRKNAPWATNEEEARRLWRQRLRSQALGLKLSGKSNSEILETLTKRHQGQLRALGQFRTDEVFQTFMNAFAANFDPHTEYYSPRSSENFNINMSLQLEGIGAVLQTDDEYTKVVRLVTGGPADRSRQLKPGDRIIGVAEGDRAFVDVVGLRIDEVVTLIRGAKGTKVRLQVIAGTTTDAATARIVVLERNTVALEDQAASQRMLTITRGERTTRVGVIKLPTFYADFQGMQSGDPNYRSTTRDVRRLIGELKEAGAQALVLDLRNNGGGSLTEANDLMGEFITTGPTVQVRDQRGRVEVLGDGNPERSYEGPLVVLTNRLSASAAEILAGAVQDYGRGLVVGSTTFGKGTVQSLREVGHGQLKLTEAKFYRISGGSTQHRGVVPDIVFPDLVNPDEIGESALDGALPWDTIAPASFSPLNNFAPRLASMRQRSQARQGQDPDIRYVVEQQQLLAEQKAQTVISLNETKRRAETRALDQRRLAIENRRREAKGQPLLKTLAELEALQEAEEARTDPQAESAEDQAILMEAAQVAVDLLLPTRTVRQDGGSQRTGTARTP